MKQFTIFLNCLRICGRLIQRTEFLKFMLPGFIVGLLFWQVFMTLDGFSSSVTFLKQIPLIGEYFHRAATGTVSILKLLFEQFFLFTILTLLSPFNTILSARTEKALTGVTYKTDLFQVLHDLLRMMIIVTIYLSLLFLTEFLYWAISALFGLSAIDPLIYFIIRSFYFGASFTDYTLERHGISAIDSLTYGFRNKTSTLLSGIYFLTLFNIPFIGVIIAPVLTTMVTTIVYLKNKNLLPE